MANEEAKIVAIVDQVIGELKAQGVGVTAPAPPPAFDGRGILEDTDSAVRAAGRSLAESREMSGETREAVIASMRRAVLSNLDLLSKMAVDETGLGRFEDKVRKNRLAATNTPGMEDLRPVAYSGDHGLTIVERAPYGLIGSITPSTNATETIICNAISMVAGGNVVVFNPHPSARAVSLTCIDVLHRGGRRAAGAPPDRELAIDRDGAGSHGASRYPPSGGHGGTGRRQGGNAVGQESRGGRSRQPASGG